MLFTLHAVAQEPVNCTLNTLHEKVKKVDN